ncbi:response regulator [Thiomicrorhabdus sp.]|uniref:response regulator n=1 Tax=Thiomicrorhabdus sp. TaxID=2039724 RepID=UPI0035691C6F
MKYRHQLLFVLPIFILIIGLMLAIFYMDNQVRENASKKQLTNLVQQANRTILNEISQIYADINYLSHQTKAKDVLLGSSDAIHNHLCNEYVTFSEQNRRYAQIRILDLTGHEVVRIDRKNGKSFRIPEDQLQDKSNRYYFTSSERLKPGEIYQSPLDLNVEQGEIEMPWRPMLRFATPITGYSHQQVIGYLVLNYDAERMLDRVENQLDQMTGDFSLINNQGYYLFSTQPVTSWGFMFNKPESSIRQSDPKLWAALTENRNNQEFSLGDDYYAFHKICSLGDCENHLTANILVTQANDLPWYIVGKLNKSHMIGTFWWQNQWPYLIALLLSLMALYSIRTGNRLSYLVHNLSKRETHLKEINQQFEKLINAVPDGLMVVNQSGIIERTNPMIETILGIPSELLLGKEIESLMPENFRNKHRAYRQEFYRAPRRIKVTRNRPFHYQHPNGSEVLLEVLIDPFMADNEIKAITLIRDVTSHNAFEEQMRQTQKMEALGQLTGGIAHDFNNLLGIMMGNLELLEMDVEEDSKAGKRLGQVKKAAMSAADLTQKLLTISRKKSLEVEAVNLNQLLNELQDMLQRSIKDRITIKLNIEDNLPLVVVDPNELTNAIINLAVNARDAMPEGGIIFLNASEVTLSDEYTRALPEPVPSGEYVLIDITDTGSGIPKALIDKVLEPFFTTKEKGKGTGLGLAMIYGFIKQSKGHMRIYSEEGKGTSIHLYLPVNEQSDKGTKAYSDHLNEGEITYYNGLKALVVDDEPDLAEVAEAFLEKLGFECEICHSADEAKEQLQKKNYDLVFSDIVMPGDIDGLELFKIIHSDYPDTKVILTSGFSEEMLQNRHLLPENLVFVRKPYQSKGIRDAIQKALQGSE